MIVSNDEKTSKCKKVFEKNGVKYYIDDEGYTKTLSNNRIVRTKEFHERASKPWTFDELVYLCQQRKIGTSYRAIGFGLSRTEGSCCQRYSVLKKSGEVEIYNKK